jgi:hypothetical protein
VPSVATSPPATVCRNVTPSDAADPNPADSNRALTSVLIVEATAVVGTPGARPGDCEAILAASRLASATCLIFAKIKPNWTTTNNAITRIGVAMINSKMMLPRLVERRRRMCLDFFLFEVICESVWFDGRT